MAKPGRSGTMQVLLNGRLVGALRLAGSGAISFTYDPDWLAWEHAMPISLSLPLREVAHQGVPVIAYLENLLPDNQAIRERVAARGARWRHRRMAHAGEDRARLRGGAAVRLG